MRLQEDAMEDHERADLAMFVGQTREVLQWVIIDRRSKVPSYLRGDLVRAWEGRTAARFTDLQNSITTGEFDDELDEHGLSGPELQAKLKAFRAYHQQWVDLMMTEPRLGLFRRRSVPGPIRP
jgi:hypothetical protein